MFTNNINTTEKLLEKFYNPNYECYLGKETDRSRNDLLSTKEIDSKIDHLIENAKITKETNPFFIKAKQVSQVPLEPALMIAFNWREITKKFMFTVLTGLGVMAEKINELDFPSKYAMRVLQTGIAVISDDLNNVFPALAEKAPSGPEGAHYIWWENSILVPLLEAGHKKSLPIPIISSKTKRLLQNMNKLSKNSLGVAIQLRVVEAIALDIVLAFLPLFSKTSLDTQPIFQSRENLSWITAHIKAEVIHHRQVTHDDNGVMNIVNTIKEQEELFFLAEEYINSWKGVFEDFYAFLDSGHVMYDNKIEEQIL